MFGRILIVGLVIGELGGAIMDNCETKVIGESAGQSVGGGIAKVIIETKPSIVTQSTLVHRNPRAVTEAPEVDANGENSGSSLAKAPGGTRTRNSVKPLRKERNEGEPTKESDNHLAVFIRIFNVTKLEDITIKGKHIFEFISKGQRGRLKQLIAPIRKEPHLDLARIVHITTLLLSKLRDDEVTFSNFNPIFSFVVADVSEKITNLNDAYNYNSSKFTNISTEIVERSKQFAENITLETIESIDTLSIFLRNLTDKMENFLNKTDPQFSNEYTAAYHYFKHKRIPGSNRELSVDEYFDITRIMLCKLKHKPKYDELIANGANEIDYQIYYADYGRRLKIVLKNQLGMWNLASSYFITIAQEGDKTGEEWIVGK